MKVWVVGRIVEPAAGVTVDGTASGCSGDYEEWEDSERADEERGEVAAWLLRVGQAVAHSAMGMVTAGGMEVEDSELP